MKPGKQACRILIAAVAVGLGVHAGADCVELTHEERTACKILEDSNDDYCRFETSGVAPPGCGLYDSPVCTETAVTSDPGHSTSVFYQATCSAMFFGKDAQNECTVELNYDTRTYSCHSVEGNPCNVGGVGGGGGGGSGGGGGIGTCILGWNCVPGDPGWQ